MKINGKIWHNASPLFSNFKIIEDSLGLPEKFIANLNEEDNWGFIIKAHALIETMLTQVLSAKTDKRLETVFGKMALTGGQASKVKAAESLDLINDVQIELIELFSAIRNKYVHSAKYISMDLQSYFKGIDSNKLRKHAKNIINLMLDNPDEEDINSIKERLLEVPQQILSIALYYIIGSLLFKWKPIERAIAEKKMKREGSNVAMFIIFIMLLNQIGKQGKLKTN
ncbi:MAG: hypothetical protein WCW35_04900 [Bacteroidota bacterium]|jgi:hypothetical protein